MTMDLLARPGTVESDLRRWLVSWIEPFVLYGLLPTALVIAFFVYVASVTS
jgi:hypothetical protein